MINVRRVLFAAAITWVIMLIALKRASAWGGAPVEAGLLTCHVAAGFGYVIGSYRAMHCYYRPNSGVLEVYSGTMSTVGAEFTITWAVLAPSSSTQLRSLAGTYGGVSLRAAGDGGAGVNALVGGFENSIVLQPLNIKGNTGLDIGGIQLNEPEGVSGGLKLH